MNRLAAPACRPVRSWSTALTLLTLTLTLTLALGASQPAAAAGPQPRLRPLATAQAVAPAVSPAEAARQTLDLAEKLYPGSFPPGPQNLFFGPYAYRYYASTGLYLGVVVTPEPGKAEGDIFLLGGSYGNTPFYVGPNTRYLTPAPQTLTVDLPVNALVADIPRRVFYASIPGSVVGQGNRVATIDAATGRYWVSNILGSEPRAMTLAMDGRTLYVALDGSGEIVRLSVPDMVPRDRVQLPGSGMGQTVAESLAASPLDPEVLAVSLATPGFSPRHAGVALLRSLVVQPRRTQGHTGSNQVVFGPDGTEVFGLNNETSEFGLRRIRVRSDGLEEVAVVPAGTGYGSRLVRVGANLVAGNRVFSVAGLTLKATLPVQGVCSERGSTQALCADLPFDGLPRVLRTDVPTGSLLQQVGLAVPGLASSGLSWVPGAGPWAAVNTSTQVFILRDEMFLAP